MSKPPKSFGQKRNSRGFGPKTGDPSFPVQPVLPPGYLAPYVRTLPQVIEALLDLGQVGSGDRLYDLGCGDGRIPLAAAQRGAQSVGVDVDPERIQEARARAEELGLTDQVTFEIQDLLTTDLSTATVVTAYLLPAAHLKLRHKLQTELKPGSRVLTHSFDMGDWLPTQTAEVSDVINRYPLYLWVVGDRDPLVTEET